MSHSSLSDRLKNVENELNDITSLMSIKESHSTSSRTSSDTSLLMTNQSGVNLSSRRSSHSNQRFSTNSNVALRHVRSRSTTCSDTKLKEDCDSSKSTLDSSEGEAENRGGGKGKRCREACPSGGTTAPLLQAHHSIQSHCRQHHKAKRSECVTLDEPDRPQSGGSRTTSCVAASLPVMLQPSMFGDTILPDFESMQTYLHSINSTIIKGNQAVSVLSKISGISTDIIDFTKPSSAPCSHHGSASPRRYKDLLKEISDERTKRISTEQSVDQMKAELKRYKQESRKNKELYTKYCQLSQQLEKENLAQVKQLKALERTNEEAALQIDMQKQKYDGLLKDLQMDKERCWEQEREIKRLKDCLDQTQLKMQELMGARTMAVELAHDLQKKHQTYVLDHQHSAQELKTKNMELEKMVSEMSSEKKNITERLESLEQTNIRCQQLQLELDDCKRNLGNAQKTVFDLTRNPEGIPQVRSLLDAQEQSFKAALTEKATSEMALQAKYTTLEVELQIIQEENNKRISELEGERNRLSEENKWRQEDQRTENEKLKVVIQELTELSNQYKARINELSDINKHQEVLIKCQNEAISSKEERVRLNSQEADLNMRRADQERKMVVAEYDKEINNLNNLLAEERDKVRVKEKVADDQAESIIQLKQNVADRAKELKRKMKDVQQLEQSLKQEKHEKENLLCDVQHLKMLRTRMHEQNKELKDKLEKQSANSMHKHSIMLEELEKKVVMKQSEWDSQITKLKTERDQAIDSAQYAIENLSKALEEHQIEISSHKSLQSNMATVIKEKEDQLAAAENKVMQLEQNMLYLEKIPIGDRKRYMSPERQPVKLSMASSATLKHTQNEMAATDPHTHSRMMNNLSLQNVPYNY